MAIDRTASLELRSFLRCRIFSPPGTFPNYFYPFFQTRKDMSPSIVITCILLDRYSQVKESDVSLILQYCVVSFIFRHFFISSEKTVFPRKKHCPRAGIRPWDRLIFISLLDRYYCSPITLGITTGSLPKSSLFSGSTGTAVRFL